MKKLTKAERKAAAAQMLARGCWWERNLGGEPDPPSGRAMWSVIGEIFPPPRNAHGCAEWATLWMVAAEGVRIGALP